MALFRDKKGWPSMHKQKLPTVIFASFTEIEGAKF